MKRSLSSVAIAVFLLAVATSGHAQKSDYVWLSGYNAYPHPVFDPVDSIYYATTVMDFNDGTVKLSPDSLRMNFDKTNVSFCDSDGTLLFYSNGIYIANALDEKITNGDSLNPSWVQYAWDTTIKNDGYRSVQGILALQGFPGKYYLIHSLTDSVPGFRGHLYVPKVLSTYIDLYANIGHGAVNYKNKEIVFDPIGMGSELTATRHGNGKDWWILVQKRNSTCYYRILLDTSGPNLLSDLTCGIDTIIRGDIGATCFSPDGSKYIYLSDLKGLTIFDFDRCSGILGNPRFLELPIIASSHWLGIGVAISPNNRFLYVSATKQLYQIDLQDPNPFENIDTIGIFDGFYVKPYSQLTTLFNTCQLGPDGKIYISCGNGVPYYHVINNPDLKGDSCNFRQHSLHLFAPSWGVPNFPNYRLGALSGSVCDTLTGLDEVARGEKEKKVKVFPNPAIDVITVDYGFTDWSKPDVNLEIANELGQIVYRQTLPRYSGFQKIDVSRFASGLYTAYIKRNNTVVAISKFAKD